MSKELVFSLDDAEEQPSRRSFQTARYASGPGWFSHFTATFCGALLAGLLLAIGIRFYLHWSISDTWKQMEKPMKEMQDDWRRDAKGQK